jgi:hypothetical protein
MIRIAISQVASKPIGGRLKGRPGAMLIALVDWPV